MDEKEYAVASKEAVTTWNVALNGGQNWWIYELTYWACVAYLNLKSVKGRYAKEILWKFDEEACEADKKLADDKISIEKGKKNLMKAKDEIDELEKELDAQKSELEQNSGDGKLADRVSKLGRMIKIKKRKHAQKDSKISLLKEKVKLAELNVQEYKVKLSELSEENKCLLEFSIDLKELAKVSKAIGDEESGKEKLDELIPKAQEKQGSCPSSESGVEDPRVPGVAANLDSGIYQDSAGVEHEICELVLDGSKVWLCF